MFLYLDIDGVAIPDGHDLNSISFAAASRLRKILDVTGAKIVVSSHRRTSKVSVLSLLAAAGFNHSDFADNWSTPILLTPSPDTSVRGQEIAQHLQDNRPQNYVIIDDCPVLPAQGKFFVQTDPRLGITDADADRAISILLAKKDSGHSEPRLAMARVSLRTATSEGSNLIP
jgi:hypothetical protein